jgi:glycosyltransferase involved in cell wall biosynthesis
MVRVSICIPLYNGIEFLEETLVSVKAQIYKDYEVLIGVNGWPAGSEVYKRAAWLLNAHQIPGYIFDFVQCQGKPETLNALVAHAHGDWIALLDADDVWHPQKLEIQMSLTDHFDVIGSQCMYFGTMSGSPSIPMGDISEFDFFSVNPLLNSSVLLKKEYALWNPENRILEDYELWLHLRYRNHLRMYNIKLPLMFHRIHPTSHFNGTNANAVDDLKERMRKLYSQ